MSKTKFEAVVFEDIRRHHNPCENGVLPEIENFAALPSSEGDVIFCSIE